MQAALLVYSKITGSAAGNHSLRFEIKEICINFKLSCILQMEQLLLHFAESRRAYRLSVLLEGLITFLDVLIHFEWAARKNENSRQSPDKW